MNSMTITGMTCAGCASKVEAALQKLSAEVRVTLDPPLATVPPTVSAAMVTDALEAIGKYRVALPQAQPMLPSEVTAWLRLYYPLLVIMGLIAVASFAGQSWMMSFMAGFYIVFGAFKLLDVPAFANAYARYDIVAKAFRPWGYAYSFVELALGFAFLFWFQMGAATWISLILSLVGAVGVVQSVRAKETVQCACLGTVFQLPMSTVTIVENVGMAAMAAWMLHFGM